jgi:DNA segregation ATPase FtsK/SpoIIIE-like protein
MGRKEDQVNKQPPWWKKLWVWTGFGEKKLWDWLQLLSALAIPVVLAVAGFWFADQQQQQQQSIENQRADHEREIQKQQAQDIALQAYLSQMGQLILEEDLRDPEEVSERVSTLARVRTITVLSRLDPNRKHSVMQFLIEAHLVQGVGQGGECCKEPIIALHGASLRDVTFPNAPLEGAYLGGADLSGANLRGAYLSDADLGGANLDEANLRDADLRDADLSDAHLSDAGLSGASLSEAYLSEADLSDANLSGAKGITQERLDAQAKTFEGATMPDGQKMPHEPEPIEWGGRFRLENTSSPRSNPRFALRSARAG